MDCCENSVDLLTLQAFLLLVLNFCECEFCLYASGGSDATNNQMKVSTDFKKSNSVTLDGLTEVMSWKVIVDMHRPVTTLRPPV